MHLKQLVHGKNLKFTPAREAILKIFSNASQPLAYEDIKTKLTMDKATFYRNMTTFEKKAFSIALNPMTKRGIMSLHNRFTPILSALSVII